MNVPLLRKIPEAITAEPGHFDMAFYASPSPCGTTACIAGWAVALRTGHALEELEERKTRGVEQLAVEALDLSLFSAGALFHVSRWPEPFQSDYWAARTRTERAAVAVRRIEHLLQPVSLSGVSDPKNS